MEKKYYIAYGSNLNVKQMSHRCPTARPLGTATLDGWTLLFKGSKTGSYLTIEPKEGSSVPVAVWEVSERDERYLDHYEGYPNFYYKKDIEVTFTGLVTKRKRTRTAFVYIMHEDRPLGQPSKYYLEVCAEGYMNFGFDLTRLLQAVTDSKEEQQ
jgi:hypothetical protein